jgi:hypothetical protein
MSNPAILSLLAEQPRHHDLLGLTTVAGVPVVNVPIDTLGRADLVVSCADGAMLGLVYLDLNGLFTGLRTNELMARLVSVKARWPWSYLVIGAVLSADNAGRTRNNAGQGSGWSWDAVQGALLSAQEIGVGVMQIPHADLFADTVARLAKRDRSAERVKPVRDAMFYTPQEELLLALPGIGETTADMLLQQCGTVAAALMALTDDSVTLAGIGPKTRQGVRHLLGLPDGQALAPYQADVPAKRGAKDKAA